MPLFWKLRHEYWRYYFYLNTRAFGTIFLGTKLSLLNLVFHTQYQIDFLTPAVMFEIFLQLASCKNPPNKSIRDIQNSLFHYYEF